MEHVAVMLDGHAVVQSPGRVPGGGVVQRMRWLLGVRYRHTISVHPEYHVELGFRKARSGYSLSRISHTYRMFR